MDTNRKRMNSLVSRPGHNRIPILKTMVRVLTAFALLVFCGVHAPAASFYVDVDVSTSGSGGQTDPYKSIREAYNAAESNSELDNIYIASGTYNNSIEQWSTSGAFTYNQSMKVYGGYAGFDGGSSYDWSTRDPRSTVIDLNGANTRAFESTNSATDPDLTLDGLTISNASITGNGGAVYAIDAHGTPYTKYITINDCLFSDNEVTGYGGALYTGSYLRGITVTNSEFTGNSATTYGGAAVLRPEASIGTGTVANCTFTDNTAGDNGGGLYASAPSNGFDCTDSRFEGNAATDGGGIYVSGSNPAYVFTLERSVLTGNTGGGMFKTFTVITDVRNSEVSDNIGYGIRIQPNDAPNLVDSLEYLTVTGNSGNGIYTDVQSYMDGNVDVINSILANNGGYGFVGGGWTDNVNNITYSDVWNNVSGGVGGWRSFESNNLYLDPLFFKDTYQLHLDSPLLAAATDLGISVDLLGALRPQDGGYAMGAYETAIPEPASLGLLGLAALSSCLLKRGRK
ncbi:MAG: right-handed parallel beta-helix repeat-containing protein [Candidatus Pacebacteria bacterium]|nr:right-handed parallel beta-helix repeat-containing protein [Candidatus Paceibacterota bacterium]